MAIQRPAILAVVLLLAATLAGCGGGPARHAAASAPPPASPAEIARGAYLARVGDCVSCHTRPGGKPYAGGRAFRVSMGTLYSPNITPDRETGIGRWTDEGFIRAMRDGVAPHGQHYYPAFPYNYFALARREDLLAIKAYLFSLPPVRYQRPPADMHFPYNFRWLMVFWNWLYDPGHRFRPSRSASAAVNRGAYLVNSLGHCGACHTPVNFIEGPKYGDALAGHTVTGWHAFNITSSRDYGIGGWSVPALVQYLSTGHADGHGSASGPMAEVIDNSLRYLRPADVDDIAIYLRSTRPRQGDGMPASLRESADALASRDKQPPPDIAGHTGARLFAGACIGCHTWSGAGRQSPYATVTGASAFLDPRATNLAQVILRGSHLETAQGMASMPAFGGGYSNAEIAALVAFISGRFGRPSAVTARQIGKFRSRPAEGE